MKYVCDICGYVYDPEIGDPDNGVAPGTPWEEVPEDWTCPLCGVGKDQFSEEEYRIRHSGEGMFRLRFYSSVSSFRYTSGSLPCSRQTACTVRIISCRAVSEQMSRKISAPS